VRGRRCPGRPFYRRPREGSGGARRAPVRCTAPALMPHSGDDETSRWGRYRARTRSSGEDGAVPNSPVRRGDGRGDDDGGDGGVSYVRKTTKRLTGGAGLLARGSAREGVAGRWGRLVSEREGGEHRAATRAQERADNGPKGGSAGARGRGGGRGMGQIQPSRGESFLFFFLFSNSHFHFCFFSF
jgi:ATP-dependent RNA helicase DeaD